MVVAFTTTTLVADAEAKCTLAPVTKPEPVMVTDVPPATVPAEGDSDVTVGTGS